MWVKNFPEEKSDLYMSFLPRVSHIVDCSLVNNLYDTLLEKCIEISKLPLGLLYGDSRAECRNCITPCCTSHDMLNGPICVVLRR